MAVADHTVTLSTKVGSKSTRAWVDVLGTPGSGRNIDSVDGGGIAAEKLLARRVFDVLENRGDRIEGVGKEAGRMREVSLEHALVEP